MRTITQEALIEAEFVPSRTVITNLGEVDIFTTDHPELEGIEIRIELRGKQGYPCSLDVEDHYLVDENGDPVRVQERPGRRLTEEMVQVAIWEHVEDTSLQHGYTYGREAMKGTPGTVHIYSEEDMPEPA